MTTIKDFLKSNEKPKRKIVNGLWVETKEEIEIWKKI